MRFFGRLLLLTVGLGLAIPFGFLALLVGVTLDPAARDLLGALGLASIEAIVSDLADGVPADAEAFSFVVELWAGLTTLLVAPPAFAALVGEVAGWRSFASDGGAAGALLFTCNGRGSHMFTVPDHDAGAVEDALGVPAGGFFCAGEIGPVGGRNFVHGFTATLAVFAA